MYLKYALWALLSLAFNFVVWLLAPVVAIPAAIFKLASLPVPLSWFYTHDTDIYGSATTHEPIPGTVWGRYKRAVWWMYRNPGYGFDAYVLGYPADGSIVNVGASHGTFGSNDGAILHASIVYPSGLRLFSYRRDVRLTKTKYLKVWFGWHYVNQAGRRMLKIDITPKSAEIAPSERTEHASRH